MTSDLAERVPELHDPVASAARTRWWWRPEALVATLGVAGLVAVALTHAPALLEPDDYAYRASIVALSKGHLLLSTAQYRALVRELASFDPSGIAQWHHLASGKWISEKNPGYPFLAVAFYMANVLRLAPLFYGALGAFGLYHGARAWLGRGAGAYAVWLYCFSGAALVFAWRSTMPSFTDAALIAAGAGGLVWALLRRDVGRWHRRLVGLASFGALELAVFVRYTDVVELLVAALAVVLYRRAARLDAASAATWLASVALCGAGLFAFNDWAYGHATSTGYSAGEINFSLSALWPNVKTLPYDLAKSLPAWLLAGAALLAIVVRAVRHRRAPDVERGLVRRDLVVAAPLAVGWLGLWLWYLTYTWTAQMGAGGGDIVHVIRFYLPAIGPIALLGAWALSRLDRRLSGGVVAVLALGALLSFYAMAGASAPGAGGHAGPGAVGSPGAPLRGGPPSQGPPSPP